MSKVKGKFQHPIITFCVNTVWRGSAQEGRNELP